MSASSDQSETLVVEIPGSHPTATVIWMHGLGDSPMGWADFCSDLADSLQHVRFVLPQAPRTPVTCNGGMVMPSWMDLIEIPIRVQSPDNGKFQDSSISIIHNLIASEIGKGIAAERIVLGGFSQGAALALAATIKAPQKIGGCISLSGWALPEQALGDSIAMSPSAKSPFLVCHGEEDRVVEYPNARIVSDLLLKGGCEVHLKTYAKLAHSSCPQVCEVNSLF